ncbi:uncharacterized protein LOC132259072 [Phlebotomus argentipes]|uniref:uncharacterized protein LOC132259072 n=1 Tax=Phlebotomus argentipes TaxID=94469 RepID=UPI002892AF3D|nr:uncharacterized protein LOC132259072 [Phlebotomus argentipes]
MEQEIKKLAKRFDRMERKLRERKRKKKQKRHGRNRSTSRGRSRIRSASRHRTRSRSSLSSSKSPDRSRKEDDIPSIQSHNEAESDSHKSEEDPPPDLAIIDNDEADILTAGEVIEVLGKRLYQEKDSAPEIFPEMAVRWDEIIGKGIPDDVLKILTAKYPPPKNCGKFEPSKLNPVVKATMSEKVVSRDNQIVKRQEKLSAALSAIATALSVVVTSKPPEWKSLAETLSDANKIISDVQHDQALIRRTLIVANVGASMRDTLKETEIGEFLFGDALEETIKNTKTLQAASKDLKESTPRTKNWKAPQRQHQRTQKTSTAASGGEESHHVRLQTPALETANAILGRSYPGGRSLVKQSCERKGIPSESHEIVLQSLSESSWKQYNTGWKKWWEFCTDNNLDPFETNTESVFRFLTTEFNKGVSYGTLNSYRSALSMIVGSWLAQDEGLKRFFKGVVRIRPSKPKYDSTWDPKVVLELYRQKPINAELTLKDLSFKLIILLALITGHRMQTFSLINIEDIRETEERIEIRIPKRIKTSSVGRSQPVLIIPFYNEEPKLCVASTLKHYLSKTNELRGAEKQLFISHKRPHKLVGAQTLSHWVKNVLEECEIDTTVFSGYSTRHAATSAANRKGLDIEVIKKTAGWTMNSHTFVKFYNLPLANNKESFANVILQG